MKVCVFGCKNTTRVLVREVRRLFGIESVITIDPEKGKRIEVADYSDLSDLKSDFGIRIHNAFRYDLISDNDLQFFKEHSFDLGFVAGWQRLVPPEILETFSIGVFGMHGSSANLPKGRGRSPMNWSLIEGRQVFYTNLFRYDPGVDSGDIIDTFCFSIRDGDTSETLHYKNILSMTALIRRNRGSFLERKLTCRGQDDVDATYYPKRQPSDSLIDWEAPIERIERFIRAVAPPFNGAFTTCRGRRVTLFRTEIFELDSVPLCEKGENGEVIEVFPSGKFLVCCSGGVLIVHEFEVDGEAVIERGDRLSDGESVRKVFPLNRHGGHDIGEEGMIS